LNRLQEADAQQISFSKFTLEKFAHTLDAVGKCIRANADTIGDSADIVSAETDLRIFITHFKSKNSAPTHETFVQYRSKMQVTEATNTV
jgi:hypothetical protein